MTNRSQQTPCRQAPPSLAAALGGLTPADAALVARLRSLPEAEPSAGLTARILAALPPAQPAARPAPLNPFIPALGWALAAALVLTAGGLISSSLRHVAAGGRGAAASAAAPTPAAAAVDWLAAQQEPDGTWLPSRTGGQDAYRPALTALSALALLERAPERHAAAIDRAARALLAMQNEAGAFAPAGRAALYNHALAGTALLRIAAAGGAPAAAIRPEALQRAVAYTQSLQNRSGGWDYEAEGVGNTALSVWQLALLSAARDRGWSDDQGHLRRGLAWLRRQADATGAFGYRAPGVANAAQGTLTLSAMGAATLLDAARHYPALGADAAAAAAALRQRPDDAKLPLDYYRDFFLARALRAAGCSAEADHVATRMAAHRSTLPAAAPWRGNDAWGKVGGDLYATIMALLTPGAS